MTKKYGKHQLLRTEFEILDDYYMRLITHNVKWLEAIEVLGRCRIKKNPDEAVYVDIAEQALDELDEITIKYKEYLETQTDYLSWKNCNEAYDMAMKEKKEDSK